MIVPTARPTLAAGCKGANLVGARSLGEEWRRALGGHILAAARHMHQLEGHILQEACQTLPGEGHSQAGRRTLKEAPVLAAVQLFPSKQELLVGQKLQSLQAAVGVSSPASVSGTGAQCQQGGPEGEGGGDERIRGVSPGPPRPNWPSRPPAWRFSAILTLMGLVAPGVRYPSRPLMAAAAEAAESMLMKP